MIYKFKVLSEEDDKFFMDVEILSDQTFYDFHNFLQEELEYDSSFLAKFFISTHNWQRKQEIPLIADKKSAKNTIIMDKAILANYMKDAHQKLIYLFDILNDRTFFIELMETIPDSTSRYYPICTDFGGEIPHQIGKKASKNNIFDDDDEIDVFSSKKVAPILDDDEETFSPDVFDKDINFEFEEDPSLSDEVDEEEEQVDDNSDVDDDIDKDEE